jgi:hypothetical protein
MPEVQQTGNGWAKAMRWTARLVTLVVAGLFVFFVIERGAKVFAALSWAEPQGMPLLLSLLVALAGVHIAWRWEIAGGVMAAAGAGAIIALVCLGSGLDMFLCALYFTLPLLVAGALYLCCGWRARESTPA